MLTPNPVYYDLPCGLMEANCYILVVSTFLGSTTSSDLLLCSMAIHEKVCFTFYAPQDTLTTSLSSFWWCKHHISI